MESNTQGSQTPTCNNMSDPPFHSNTPPVPTHAKRACWPHRQPSCLKIKRHKASPLGIPDKAEQIQDGRAVRSICHHKTMADRKGLVSCLCMCVPVWTGQREQALYSKSSPNSGAINVAGVTFSAHLILQPHCTARPIGGQACLITRDKMHTQTRTRLLSRTSIVLRHSTPTECMRSSKMSLQLLTSFLFHAV